MRAAEAVLQQLDSKLETISFDPAIPASVEAAIKQTLTVIEMLLSDFKGNPVLEPMVAQLKVQYLETIEHKVSMSQAAGLEARRLPVLANTLDWACGLFRSIR
jgi:saccharopine dehydrogenase-like NADP-dependent oxidoreductase